MVVMVWYQWLCVDVENDNTVNSWIRILVRITLTEKSTSATTEEANHCYEFTLFHYHHYYHTILYVLYEANGMVPTTGMVVDEVVNDATYV